MHVHENPGPQARQDLQVQVLDIAADPEDVTGIDEQDVVLPQFLEDADRHVLNLGRDRVRQSRNSSAHHRSRIGIDGGEPAGGRGRLFGVPPQRLGGETGRQAGPDLDHASRPEAPDHAVQDLGVHQAEPTVVQIKGAGRTVRLPGERLVLAPVGGRERAHELDLISLPEIDTRGLRPLRPERVPQRAGVGNRLIEMHRRDMEPPRLPEVEVTRIAKEPRGHETRGQTRDPVPDEGLRTQGHLPSSLVEATPGGGRSDRNRPQEARGFQTRISPLPGIEASPV